MADRLAAEGDAAVGELARRDVLGLPPDPGRTLTSPVVRALLGGLLDERTLRRPYGKWTGAHWRLVSLVELGIPPGNEITQAACDRVLSYWARPARLERVPVIDGRARRCASQEGNAVAVACRLGQAEDDRVQRLVEHLVRWQWPDGGWNCDRKPAAHRSSFHESLPPMWGLHEYAAATGAQWAREAAERAAELFLSHRLFRSLRSGDVIEEDWLRPHYPPFWHYDIAQALLVLRRMHLHRDPRADEALELIATSRRTDGLWPARRTWWRPPGAKGSNVEVVDWGVHASEMATLNALRVLQ